MYITFLTISLTLKIFKIKYISDKGKNMRIISGTAKGTKLYTLEGNNTRPTLDRVKESLFNIIQNQIKDAIILDLFAGSGALALESLSRGAKYAYLCDNSKTAIQIINKNIIKTRFEEKTKILNKDYKKNIENIKERFDIIFIDPPYELNIGVKSIKLILENHILKEDGIIILETDDDIREIKQLEELENITIYDLRKYGRVKLIFLNRKG